MSDHTEKALTGEECTAAIGLLIGCVVQVTIRSGFSGADLRGRLRNILGGYSVCVINGDFHAVITFRADDIEHMKHYEKAEGWRIHLKHTTT
jgi:hypothetical protein